MRLQIIAAARRELYTSAEWYRTQKPGLDGRFLDAVGRTLRHLLAFPQSGPVVWNDVRQFGMHRFPFAIVYRIDGDVLSVIAIAHHKRRPGYWRRRLGGAP